MATPIHAVYLPGDRFSGPQHGVIRDVDSDDSRVFNQLFHRPTPALRIHPDVLSTGSRLLKPDPLKIHKRASSIQHQ